MYISPNYRSKKAVKDALKEGKQVSVYSPGPFSAPKNGPVFLEGPHSPEPHKWYGEGIVKDGYLVSIK